jgi:hypothetical protein
MLSFGFLSAVQSRVWGMLETVQYFKFYSKAADFVCQSSLIREYDREPTLIHSFLSVYF